MRAWNLLALAALMEKKEEYAALIISQLPVFSTFHHGVLRSYVQSGTSIPESATTDVNHAYIAIKLWLMLVRTKPTHAFASLAVWNELWPPFDELVGVLEVEAQAGLSLVRQILVDKPPST
ncbi:hypothetical protein BD779DRAFT_1502195, partial [Infundibulicybe gibba]